MSGQGSPLVIGRYNVYGKIASGGMASVHFGRLLAGAGFSRTVAIKRLHPHLAEDPAFLSSLLDEARMAARINHPNVVPTLDVVNSDGELLIVMDYVRGESLSRLLGTMQQRDDRVPLPIASSIVIGVLHGLHAAHEATDDHGARLEIVHRDMSPQNILVGVDGVARVIDFGVAKAAGRLQVTQEGDLKGKLAYMSPEQLSEKPLTRSSDVYAMGIVLWETLACRRLFVAESQTELFHKVRSGAKEPPSWYAPLVPPALDDLVMKALARRPEDRFPTAVAMAEQLLHVVPPAFQSEVGAWCLTVARDAITTRNALLAEIESQSGGAAVSPRASDPGPAPAAGSGRPRADSRASRSSMLEEPSPRKSQASIAIETSKLRPNRASIGAIGLWLSAGVFVVMASIAGWLASGHSHSAPLASAPLASAPLASAPLASAPLASAPLASAPLASAPLFVPLVDAGTRVAASSAGRPGDSSSSASMAASTAGSPVTTNRISVDNRRTPPSCDPPWVFDAERQIRVYKKECL